MQIVDLQRTVTYTSARHTDRKSTTVYSGASRSVPILGCFVVDLIKGWEDVVGKLNLSNWPHPLSCCTYGEPYESLLAEWCVENALGAKICGKIHCAAKHTSKLDVFTKDQHPLVGLQRMAKCFVYSGVKIDTFCLPFAYVLW